MHLPDKLLKQHKVGMWLGGVKHSISQIGIYIGFVNLFLLSITTYNTGWVQEHIANVNFFGFMGIVALLVLVALLMAYKLDMPSYFGFWKKQVGLDVLEKQIKDIQATQDKILKMLEDKVDN